MEIDLQAPEDDWWHSDAYRDWLVAWWDKDFSLEALETRLSSEDWKKVSVLTSGLPTYSFAGRTFSPLHLPRHSPEGEVSQRSAVLPALQDELVSRLSHLLEADPGSSDPAFLQGVLLDFALALPSRVVRRAIDARYALFAAPLTFADLDFRRPVDFRQSHFEDCNFRNTRFQGVASFSESRFHFADFSATRFEAGANFSDSRFLGFATFTDADFSIGANFNRCGFLAEFYFDQNNTSLVSSGADKKEAFWFKGCQFILDSHFSNRDFGRPTDFSESKFYGFARFHNAKLHQDTSFRDCDFGPFDASPFTALWAYFKYDTRKSRFNYETPKQARALPTLLGPLDGLEYGGKFYQYDTQGLSEYGWKLLALQHPWRALKKYRAGHFADLEQSFRTLRRACFDASMKPEANKFFRLEMHARRRRPLGKDINWVDKTFSHLYGSFARYGESVSVPIIWIGLLFIGTSFALHVIWSDLPSHNFLFDLSGAMKAVFKPFSVWGESTVAPVAATPTARFQLEQRTFISNVAATLTSSISIALIFLAGLALRRRFQID